MKTIAVNITERIRQFDPKAKFKDMNEAAPVTVRLPKTDEMSSGVVCVHDIYSLITSGKIPETMETKGAYKIRRDFIKLISGYCPDDRFSGQNYVSRNILYEVINIGEIIIGAHEDRARDRGGRREKTDRSRMLTCASATVLQSQAQSQSQVSSAGGAGAATRASAAAIIAETAAIIAAKKRYMSCELGKKYEGHRLKRKEVRLEYKAHIPATIVEKLREESEIEDLDSTLVEIESVSASSSVPSAMSVAAAAPLPSRPLAAAAAAALSTRPLAASLPSRPLPPRPLAAAAAVSLPSRPLTVAAAAASLSKPLAAAAAAASLSAKPSATVVVESSLSPPAEVAAAAASSGTAAVVVSTALARALNYCFRRRDAGPSK